MSEIASPPPASASALSSDISLEARRTLESLKQDTSKVVVRFKAVGNAPVMKQNFFKITASNRFQMVIQFLRRELHYADKDPLFLYINASFAPCPDDTVSALYKCFGVEKQLIVNYSTTAAWG